MHHSALEDPSIILFALRLLLTQKTRCIDVSLCQPTETCAWVDRGVFARTPHTTGRL